MAITHSNLLITNRRDIINTIENTEFWERLKVFYELLKPYDHVIMILESDHATLGQVAAAWAWLREIINKLPSSEEEFKNLIANEIDNRWKKIYNPIFLITWFLHPYHHGEGINPEKLLQIQEDAYTLFCTLYPDKNNNDFVDEWLNYQNKEGPFKTESLNNSKLTKTPLRYWRTVLFHAPNLAEFACRLFSIPPNSATSERVWSLMGNIHTERRNRLSPKRTVKMTQVTWYLREKFFANNSKKTQDSLKIYNELTYDMEDGIDDLSDGDNVNVNEMINDLEQISARIIDDISIFDPNSNEILQPPTLLEIFNSRLIETALTKGVNFIL
jgi:hypothetical protein